MPVCTEALSKAERNVARTGQPGDDGGAEIRRIGDPALALERSSRVDSAATASTVRARIAA
jgi:hypothetical protein